jgi:hypothetical protein
MKILQNESKDSTMTDSTSKVDHYLGKLMTKLDSPSAKQQSVPQQVDSSGDDVFVEAPLNNELNESVPQPFESNVDKPDEISNQDVFIPPSEPIEQPIVQSEVQEAALESHPLNLGDSNDNIVHITPEKTTVSNKAKKTVETKFADTLSPADVPLKSIHSRENSASSLLEETLESAKTIASIYSVQGPTRSPDGEDCVITASEMRRHSLAKRVVRRRPKLDTSTFTNPDESVAPAETSLSEPAVQNEGDDDVAEKRSSGSHSSGGSRPDSGILSPKLEALEEQKVLAVGFVYIWKTSSVAF